MCTGTEVVDAALATAGVTGLAMTAAVTAEAATRERKPMVWGW